MKPEHLIIVIIGVLLFLFSYNIRVSYLEVMFIWGCGIVLVYLGLKMEQDKKKGMNK